ncbi:DNA helicase/exodeoxyribonuclease V subunit A [Ruminiclostridium sufflavum DSM 19573]|uniref:ATP-dependent helicase/nuclease subunit A n=1 Tax=Ruminiclostridium sufflavum DSM 19573 TaxID=1121337 RepID=A0A318XMA4_9FIRM|nr:helicase-exonuclease AddAB subunit AddA [Ruminiclostridium sufflavum]PYG87613.1 DNA helicase/exodeoxyribonuclease V subunit A [Ruminiclostridium sufflavum DSM 19573]
MPEMKWTKEQYAAITENNCNLLVAAAAGAGKTAVLVERIIQKIIDEKTPVDIDSLLVVTFTNAAATEMRERIGAAISKAIEGNKAVKSMQRQLALLSKASITTIHSFCLEVIRNNFQSIDIDPKFRILDETEAALLKSEALDELFEEIYENEENNEDFFELLESYGSNRDDRRIQELVLNIYGFVQSCPWPQKWLDKQIESYKLDLEMDFADTVWGKILLEAVKMRLEGLRDIMEQACSRLKFALGLEKYLPVFEEDADALCSLLNIFDAAVRKDIHGNEGAISSAWDRIHDCLVNIEFGTLPRCAKEADKQVQEEVRKIRDELKAYIRNLKEEVFLFRSQEIISDLSKMYPVLKCLTRLVSAFENKYAVKKNQRASVDFNDLEHFCLKILSGTDEEGNLCPTEAAKAYKEKYSEILVDEYQDSNSVQEIIINMISKEDAGTPNVFMVGDVKQSIYRFRQARPELFLDKYNSYSGQEKGLYRKILLFKNFRSRKEVIDGVNLIFKQIMSEGVSELDYTDSEKLNPAAVFPANNEEGRKTGGKVELHLIETASSNDSAGEALENGGYEEETDMSENNDEAEILDNLQKEARVVADRIAELLRPDGKGRKFSVLDKKTNKYRDLQFKDIVILLRTTKNWTDVFTEELMKSGIPTFADTGNGFFKTPEIQVILSLLQIIDNPYQDIPLLSVLRSPIAGFSTGDLAELRLADRKSSLFEALNVLASGEKESSLKARNFLGKLKEWRDMSMYMSTHKLIWQLYNDTGYFSIAGAMHDGERKQANLRVLFERALQFESTSYKGLFNFISFIDKLKTNKGDMGSAKILGENDNVVRLMSIHKSKGLEFPVVFLCGCGKKFNFQDMYKGILLHQELGFGPDFVDYKRRIKYPSAPKLAIGQRLKTETLSEEMRILYVGMTRAREKLIITGAVNSLEKSAKKWLDLSRAKQEKFPAYDILKAQNYLDWLCPSIMRHCSYDSLKGEGFFFKEAAVPEVLSGVRLHSSGEEIPWDLSAHNGREAAAPIVVRQEENHIDTAEWLKSDNRADLISINEIKRRLNWKYQYGSFASIPSKISVTEIKRFFNINNEGEDTPINKQSSIKKPLFLQEKKGLSSAEKGTVMHFVMQHIDFNNKNIENQLAGMVKLELITQKQAEAVEVGKISEFVLSPICRRMLASGRFYREVPFNIELPFEELYPAAEVNITEENILLQGVVDCYFEEEDKIILIDYKTDYISKGSSLEEIKKKYGIQLSYYSRALEMLTGLQVSERYVYLFYTGELLEM